MRIRDYALEAYDAGFTPLPPRHDGNKSPGLPTWREYQTTRPARSLVADWFHDRIEGIGFLCGRASGGLVMFEFEGLAVAQGLDRQFLEQLKDLGHTEIAELLQSWIEESPSGGLHLHWRCPDHIINNLKLAFTVDGQVLIETRGEGGYTVAAPSGGRVHKDGKRWRRRKGNALTCPTLTAEQQQIVLDLARSFNQKLETTEPTIDTPTTTYVAGSDEISDLIAKFNANEKWERILHGVFEWVGSPDRDGVQRLKFIGQESGTGATLYHGGKDRLIVWSGTAAGHGWRTAGDGPAPTYDKFSAYVFIKHGNHSTEARMQVLRDELGFRTPTELDDDLGINRLAKSPIQRQAEQELEDPPDGTSAAVENDEPVDPDTHQANWIFDLKWIAELGLNAMFDLSRAIGLIPPVPHVGDDLQLPDQFWSSRPILQHLSQAADNALVPRDALLGATLGIVGAHTDWRYVLPPFGDRGRIGALNVHIGLVGQSGAGKGSAIDLGHDLLRPPHQEGHRVRRVPAGSGEGMVKAFFELQKDDDDKRRYVLKKAADSVFIEVQEGEFLKNLAQRQGQTTLQVMRSAWSGEHLGGTYSNEDKNAHLSAHMYRWTMICAVQPSLAGPLLDDEAGGTAQRQLWFSLHNPNITGTSIDPGPLNWKPIRWVGQQPGKKYIDLGDGEYNRTVLTIDIAIHTELRNARIAAIKNSTNTAPGHRNLAKLKTAALLAILEGRTHIRIDDWHLAECIHKVSDNLADMMRQVIASEEQQVARRQGAVDAARQTSRRNEAEWIAGAAVAFGKRVRTKGPQTDNDLKNSLRSDKRGLVETVKHTAVANGWITWDSSSSRWVAGSQEPT